MALCDHPEGWDREGRRETQEEGDMRIYVYVELILFVIKQKPADFLCYKAETNTPL